MEDRDISTDKPRLLMLGTGHWDNPGLDLVGLEYDDMLAEGRQAEIRDLIERLKEFRPTKVAVEVGYARMEIMNERYRGYKAGTFTLTANEVYQVGFRLAETMSHDRIYCIDTQGSGDWEGVFAYARQNGQSEKIDANLKRIQDEMAQLGERMKDLSVLEMLRDNNDPVSMKKDHEFYTDLAVIGEGDKYPGAELVGDWYERNLKMFVNITRITTTPDDRIFLIVGAGHVPYIRHFLENSGRYKLEDVGSYLEDRGVSGGS